MVFRIPVFQARELEQLQLELHLQLTRYEIIIGQTSIPDKTDVIAIFKHKTATNILKT